VTAVYLANTIYFLHTFTSPGTLLPVIQE
jgi:hypothetical protein